MGSGQLSMYVCMYVCMYVIRIEKNNFFCKYLSLQCRCFQATATDFEGVGVALNKDLS